MIAFDMYNKTRGRQDIHHSCWKGREKGKAGGGGRREKEEDKYDTFDIIQLILSGK